MRNDDLSQSGNHHLTANDDYDVIPAGSSGQATGNTISGQGTVSGAAGADDTGAGHAHITGITGAGGGEGSAMEAAGRYGSIKIDAQGNYTYTRHHGSPDNVEDVFTYTLTDKSGTLDSARLVVRIDGKEEAKIQDNAQRIVAGNEVITLPAGVELSDIHVVGRDLVINLPDGTQMVITDGAVFVPQLALGDVEIPSDTLASLLIDSEPRPAAGPPESSGGNFGEPVAPLDPGVPLGDLLPPTELGYTPPEFEETYIPQRPNTPDNTPEIFVQPDGQPASVAATDEVDEGALPARIGEPAGSHSASTDEATSGNIVFSSPDGVQSISITINGTDYVVFGPGAVTDIPGDYGTLHINSVDIAGGTINYTYTLLDNVNHLTDTTPWEDFAVKLVDGDGDAANATLRINIADDVPTANPDVDSVTEDGTTVADGNVFSGAGGSDANPTDGVADVQGADGAHVTSFTFGANAGTFGVPLQGTYGELVLNSNGAYVYTLHNGDPAVQALGAGETRTEIYNYTIVDGDGDPSTTTLTITITGSNDLPVVVSGSTAVTEEAFLAPEDNAGNPDSLGNPTDTASNASASGDLSITDVDGDALTVTLSAPAGSFTSHGDAITWALTDGGHTLTGSANGGAVIVVTITDAGHYTVNLLEQIDHPVHGTSPATSEDVLDFVVGVHASDGGVPVDGSLTIHVEDDSPIVTGAPVLGIGVDIDESDSGTPVLSPAGAITVSSTGAIITAPVSYGGDGQGAAPAYTITLNNTATGLMTADGDHAITLVQVDSTHINGVFNDGADKVAFSVTINVDGSLTVTQNYAMEHSDAGDTAIAYNDTNSPLTLDGLVTAHVVYEDYDHDRVEASGNIGQLIRFFDDGPTADVTVQLPEGQALDGLALVTSDDGTEDDGSTMDSTSANFGGAFSLSTDGGADGLASSNLAFDLNLVGSGDGPVDSGLDSHGQTIYLYQLDANTIVGSTSVDAVGVGTGNTVFQLSTTDGGAVTLTQYMQVDHPIAGDPSASGAPFGDDFAVLGSGLVQLVGTGTATDNDGDFANDSQALDMGGLVRFGDDGPAIDASLNRGAHLIVDESLPGTVPGETEPAGTLGQASVAISDLITVSDTGVSADAPTTYSYGLVLGLPVGGLVDSGLMTSDGNHEIYLYDVGGTIVGSTSAVADGSGVNAGNTVFTVAISGGDVVLTQYQAIEHFDAPSNFNELSGSLAEGALGLQVTATDYDGDTAKDMVDLGSVIQFNDDGPSAGVTLGQLPTDPAALAAFQLATGDDGTEGALSTTDSTTANFGGLFGLDVDGGSDGVASSSLTFDLNLVGSGDGPVDSGLDSHGQTVYLYQLDANTIVGSTSANAIGVGTANTVFQLSTTDGGAVTLTQYMQVDHPIAGDPSASGAPFVDDVAVLGGDLVQVVATGSVTDNDGDIANDSQALDLGGLVRFADDGPAIDATIKAGASLHIDESNPGTDIPGETDATGLGQLTVALSNLVTVADTQVSADAPTTYGYALVLGPTTGGLVDSGLMTSDGDHEIYLYNIGGTIYGSTSTVANGSGVNGGNTVFTVTISGGNVVMTQFQAIEHIDTANFDENSSPLASGALNLQVTATDYDGDTAKDTVDLGSIVTFGDDGPSAADHIVGGTQPEGVNVVIDVSGDIDGGSDGLDHVQILTNSGTGSLTYDPGTGQFTYAPTAGESGSVTFTYRVFDKDGDHDDATVSFNLAADSKPSLSVTDLTVDEKGLPNGTGELANVALNSDTSETASGTMTIGTGNDTLGAVEVQDKDGNWVNVTAATVGTPVVVQGTHGTLSVTSDGAGHYSYSYTLTAPYTHPDHFPAGVDGDGISGAADPINGDNFAVRVTDNEGDQTTVTAGTTINVTVLDDAPTAALNTGTIAIVHDETTGLQGDAQDVTAFSFPVGSPVGVDPDGSAPLGYARSSGTISSTGSLVGADQPGSTVISLDVASAGVDSGLQTTNGTHIFLFNESGVIVGRIGANAGAAATGDAAFALRLDATNHVEMVQFLSVKNPTGGSSHDEPAYLADNVIKAVVTVTDADSDVATASAFLGHNSIGFQDDGPTAGLALKAGAFLIIDETDGAVANANETDGAGGNLGVATMTAANLFVDSSTYGVDGKASAVYSLQVNGSSTAGATVATTLITSNGNQPIALYLMADGSIAASTSGTYAGVNAGNTVFTVSIAANGTTTMTQYQALEHTDAPSNYNESTVQGSIPADGIQVVLTATDGDADTSTAVVDLGSRIQFLDDGPTAAVSITGAGVVHDETAGVQLDANDVASLSFTVSNPGTDAHGGSPLGYAVGTTAISSSGSVYGSDSAGSTSVKLEVAPGGVDSGVTTTEGVKIWLFDESGVIVGRVGATAAAAQTGVAAFALRLDATNHIEMVQYLSVHNPTGGASYDETQWLADNVIKATVTVIDSDGDKNSASSFLGHNSIGFQDDGPSAGANGSKGSYDDNVAGQNIGTVASLTAAYGVDGPAASGAITIATGDHGGTISIVGGNLIYTSHFNVAPGGNVVETFTYTVKDGDDDTATGTFTVTLTDTGPSIGAIAATIAVDEEGLTNGIAGTSYGDGSDLAGVATSQSGTFAGLSYGTDGPGNIVLGAVADTGLRTLSNQVVKSAWDGTTHTLTGFVDTNGNGSVDVGETKVFTLQVTDTTTGAYTFSLLQPVKHDTADTEDDKSFNVAVTVTDAEGDPAVGSISITIDDDSPTQIAPDSASLTNNASGLFNGFLDADDSIVNNLGADGGKAVFSATGLPSLTAAGGQTVHYAISADGQTLTAYIGADSTNAASNVFTAHISGSSYSIDMGMPIDSLSTVDFLNGGYAHNGGNPDYYAFFKTAVNPSPDLLLTPVSGGTSVNLNSNVYGVGSGNDMGSGDVVRLDFVTDIVTSGGSIGDWTFAGHYNVNGASVGIAFGNDSTARFTAFDDTNNNQVVGDGTIDPITQVSIKYGAGTATITPTTTYTPYVVGGHTFWVVLNGDGSVSVGGLTGNANGTVQTTVAVFTASGYNSLTVGYEAGAHGGDTFKIGGTGAAVQSTAPVNFDIPVHLVDGDGDTTSDVNIHVTATTPAPPVVLDTNHDGAIGFLGLDTGVLYDMNGDGHLDHTAWAASGDSILFVDSDHNGTVSGANEFVFGHDGMTDLEALHAMYGAQLDANDANFTMFALWNDANSNGIVDGGEVQTLAEAGITSISLVSDGVAGSAADGDVQVHGTGEFAYVNDNGDASTGKLADASFAFHALTADEEQRLTSTTTSTTLLAVAAAAAALADTAAAAAPTNDHAADQPAVSPQVNIAPTLESLTVAEDDAPQNSLLANDGDKTAEAAPAAHHNAVVAEESNVAIDAGHDDAGPQALPQGSDAPQVDSTPLVDVAPMTVAAAADAPGVEGVHHNAVMPANLVEQPDSLVEQVLAKVAANDAVESLAHVQSGGNAVQGWDMASFGHLSAAVMEHIGAEASLLHPDAVQPVMHG